MSNFTKDELVYLFEAVDSDIVCFNEPDIAYKVRDKLKFMIDNYCEHVYSMGSGRELFCAKCEGRNDNH